MSDEDRIRQRAYALWEAEGRPEGRHADHWSQACAEEAETPTAMPSLQPPPLPETPVLGGDLSGSGPNQGAGKANRLAKGRQAAGMASV